MSALAAKTPVVNNARNTVKTNVSSNLYAVPSNLNGRKIVGTRTVLTQRGRVVLGLFTTTVVLAVLAFIFAAFAPNAAASTQTTQVEVQTIVVQPSETLWQIATDLDPSADPRELIDRILDLNSLSNSEQIHAGQALVVPVIK
jgi:hypothetical protein